MVVSKDCQWCKGQRSLLVYRQVLRHHVKAIVAPSTGEKIKSSAKSHMYVVDFTQSRTRSGQSTSALTRGRSSKMPVVAPSAGKKD